MSIFRRLGGSVGARAGSLAPGPNSAVVHRALEGAIHGVGPLPGAAAAADAQLADGGDLQEAVSALIRRHVAMSAAQGLLTNVGGLVTLAATVPANIAGLALIQCRMAAAIARVHGLDLEQPEVRNAVLMCVIGESQVRRLIKKGTFPSGPGAVARSAHDPAFDRLVATQVTGALMARVGGRRAATMFAKRVPLLGGVVGGVSDAQTTRSIGRYAGREFSGALQQPATG